MNEDRVHSDFILHINIDIMKIKHLIKIFLILSFVFKGIKDVDLNINSKFNRINSKNFIFVSTDGVTLRIMEGNVGEMNIGFEKYNDTIYIFDEVIDKTDECWDFTIYFFECAEYIKINGKTYWVEFSNESIKNPNKEKCFEHLNYFNEHNTFEVIKI